MIKLFILSNFILISHFGRSMDDTIFFNTIDYVFFNNLYYTPDTSSFLRDGVYVKFESYTSLTIGKIENGERVGAWITTHKDSTFSEDIVFYKGNTILTFEIHTDSIVKSYIIQESKVLSNYKIVGLFPSDLNKMMMVFKSTETEYTLISDFAIRYEKDEIYLETYSELIKKINYQFLNNLLIRNKMEIQIKGN
jgi:hypothetical protein